MQIQNTFFQRPHMNGAKIQTKNNTSHFGNNKAYEIAKLEVLFFVWNTKYQKKVVISLKLYSLSETTTPVTQQSLLSSRYL